MVSLWTSSPMCVSSCMAGPSVCGAAGRIPRMIHGIRGNGPAVSFVTRHARVDGNWEVVLTASADNCEAQGPGYYLVLLRPGAEHARAAELLDCHVAFVDSMIGADVVLLGGDFGAAVAEAEAAYLLHTGSLDEAERWAARDPFVQGAVYESSVVAWELVGINLRAVDPALTD